MTNAKVKTTDNEQGFASIVIALVLVIVLSLITVGFAQLMSRNVQQALDKQLSDQAYYAAESGVNDAAQAINAGYNLSKTTCGVDAGQSGGVVTAHPGAKFLTNPTVSGSTNSSYTCLLINPTPPTLEYSDIKTTDSKTVEFEGLDQNTGVPVTIQTITISWQDVGNNTSFLPNNCSVIDPVSGSPPLWAYPGILRFELIPINDFTGGSEDIARNGNGASNSGLINNADTAFLCPSQGDGSGTIDATNSSDYSTNKGINSGVKISGNCNTHSAEPYYCSAAITGLGNLNEAVFFMNLRSIFNDTTVSIAAYGGTGAINQTDQLNITNAQTLIDSTGKAQDVLRRVQVRVPTYNGYDMPIGSQGMQSICKQLQLVPASGPGSSYAAC